MVPVPPADMKAGFFSPYFIVPKKSGGLRPILGLRILMLMQNRVFGCIRPQVRSAALTWRPVLPCVDPSVPQAIPAVCVRRTSISVQVLPFGLSLSPRVFTKVAEAALFPWENRACTFSITSTTGSYWLSLRISYANTGIGALARQPVGPSGQLGKEKTLADAEDLFSRYGVWIRSIRQRASRRNALSRCWTAWIRSRTGRRHHWNNFQRLLGHMAAAAAVTPLGLLYMRPLQHWLHGRVPRWAWQSGTLAGPSHSSLPPNLHPVVRPFIPSGRSAPGTGLQARCGLHGCLRQGLGGHVQRACSVGGLDGSPTALAYQLPRVAGSTPGLEPSQETLTRRARTGPYGQHCDRCVHQPGDSIPRRSSWFATFWTRTGRPVRVPRDVALPVVLLPDRRNTRHGRTGTQLAAGPSQICISPSEPSRTDTVQGQRGRGADPARGTILAYQVLVPRADAPRDSSSLADSSEEGSTDSETGHLMAPASRPLETSCLVPRRDAEVLGDLPQEVVDTITSARAPSTRHAYALKWNLFVKWCSSHRENPRRCPIRVVLSFLQQGLERRLSPSTLRVYVDRDCCQPRPCGREVGGEAWLSRQVP